MKPRITPPGRFVLRREQLIDRPIEEVFKFFSDTANLEPLTPPFLHFEIVTPQPVPMGVGTLIDYKLRLFGKRLNWRTRIEQFEPPHSFVDVQIQGPYSLWYHSHKFERIGNQTLMIDHVDYDIPLGVLGFVAQTLMVRRTLQSIFDYRSKQVTRLLAA